MIKLLRKKAFKLFLSCSLVGLLPFQLSAEDIASYPLLSDWQLLNTNAGIQRYGYSQDMQMRAAIVDGVAYWLGGSSVNNGLSSQNSVLSINLTTGEVNSEANLSQNFLASNAQLVYKNRIFSLGGSSNSPNFTLNNVVEFDPVTKEWRNQEFAPLARNGMMAEVYQGKIYTFGGYGFETFNRANIVLGDDGFYSTNLSEQSSYKNDIQVYDIESNSWSIIGNSPQLPPFLDSTIIDSNIYFSTGNAFSNDLIDNLSVYNITSKSWLNLTMPTGLIRTKISSLGSLLVVYGLNTDTYPVTNGDWTAYIYDTTTNQWFLGPSLPDASDVSLSFDISANNGDLYYLALSDSHQATTEKKIYKIDFDIPVNNEPYQPMKQQEIITKSNNEYDSFSINESGNILNVVMSEHADYKEIREALNESSNKVALKRLMKSVYRTIDDDFEFAFMLFNETQAAPRPAPYGYHTPIKNDIEGIGQGIFDFAENYGSNGKLESLIVLSTQFDLIYGPSLHELAHRWGNYLEMPLDSMRHKDWLNFNDSQKYHWGYLSSGGQLGGWYDEDFNEHPSIPYAYMVSDAQEGVVGFSGLGSGNNFVKYSPLEQYLMGLIPSSSVANMKEPAVQPIETINYPFYEISQFNTITMDDVISSNGERVPSYLDANKEYSALVIVISKQPLTQSEWHNYEHQVSNFTRKGQDDYQRLNNFWEATGGKANITAVDLRKYFDESLVDTDQDGMPDSWENENNLDYLLADDALLDSDEDGLSNLDEYLLSTDPNNQDSDLDGFFDGMEHLRNTDPLDSASVPSVFEFDQNGDGYADVLWRNHTTGLAWLWSMTGTNINQSQSIGSVATAWEIVGRGDFNRDGKSDILWRNKHSGRNYIWLMSGFNALEKTEINSVADTNWQVKAVGDFNGDKKADIFWHNQADGRTFVWLMDGTRRVSAKELNKVSDLSWQVVAAGDVNADGNADIIWRNNSTGANYVWQMNGTETLRRYLLNTVPISWEIKGTGDLDSDGTDDIIWRNKDDGRNWTYLMKSGEILVSKKINVVGDLNWHLKSVADYDGDDKSDIFWHHQESGATYIYLMDGTNIKSRGWSNNVGTDWQVVGR